MPDTKALILMYHSVAEISPDPWSLCVTPQHFREQLEILRKHVRSIRLQELFGALCSGDISGRNVVVTFDDGYANNLHHAKPLLDRYGIPATVFIATGYLGQKREFWWDELEGMLLQPGTLPERLQLTINGKAHQWELGEGAYYDADFCGRYRSWKAWQDPPSARHSLYISLWQLLNPLPENECQSVLNELREWANAKPEGRLSHRVLSFEEVDWLAQGKLIDVGSHTVTHSALSALPVPSQRDEIQQSKATLEDLLGRPIRSFAFPFGRPCDYTGETLTLIRDAGFTCSCVAFEGVVRSTTDRFQLPRFPVLDWDGEEFERHLATWFES